MRNAAMGKSETSVAKFCLPTQNSASCFGNWMKVIEGDRKDAADV
jgi:hypothetical protein